MGNDELIRRLKTLAHTFQMLNQVILPHFFALFCIFTNIFFRFFKAEDETTYAEYTPLAAQLAEEHFLSHQSRDVQLLVACCIADILRIFAPDAPYKDPAQIKVLLTVQLTECTTTLFFPIPKDLTFKY